MQTINQMHTNLLTSAVTQRGFDLDIDVRIDPDPVYAALVS